MEDRPDSQDRKKLWREWAQMTRNHFSREYREDADATIAHLVEESAAFNHANAVLTYWSYRSEADTHTIAKDVLKRGKVLALPRCSPEERGVMQWYRIESAEELDALEPGYGGIPEPAACEERLVDLSTLDGGALALVPGLLFDRDGFRLGYGGGFYDRFLCTFPGTTMGVCYEKQMLASLSQLKVLEGHDVPVDMIVHECSGEMSCRNEL